MAGSMATTSNAAMRKKTPFHVAIFPIHDTSHASSRFSQPEVEAAAAAYPGHGDRHDGADLDQRHQSAPRSGADAARQRDAQRGAAALPDPAKRAPAGGRGRSAGRFPGGQPQRSAQSRIRPRAAVLLGTAESQPWLWQPAPVRRQAAAVDRFRRHARFRRLDGCPIDVRTGHRAPRQRPVLCRALPVLRHGAGAARRHHRRRGGSGDGPVEPAERVCPEQRTRPSRRCRASARPPTARHHHTGYQGHGGAGGFRAASAASATRIRLEPRRRQSIRMAETATACRRARRPLLHRAHGRKRCGARD